MAALRGSDGVGRSLVVGRPITQAAEPRQAAAAILEEANAAAQ